MRPILDLEELDQRTLRTMRFVTTPTSMIKRLTGQETWTDPVTFAPGTNIGGAGESKELVDLTTTNTVAITAAAHSGRTMLLDSTHTMTITLPQALGLGDVYRFIVKTLGTDGSKIIQVANATDVLAGCVHVANTQNTTDSFLTSATSDTVTMNNTTQGGLVGSEVVIQDIAVGVFFVKALTLTTGNPVTPFSAAVS